MILIMMAQRQGRHQRRRRRKHFDPRDALRYPGYDFRGYLPDSGEQQTILPPTKTISTTSSNATRKSPSPMVLQLLQQQKGK